MYAPEFPGTSAGDPYAIHAVHTLADAVLMYEEMTRVLGLHKPILVGQSFGGMLAAEIATNFPACRRAWCSSTRSVHGARTCRSRTG